MDNIDHGQRFKGSWKVTTQSAIDRLAGLGTKHEKVFTNCRSLREVPKHVFDDLSSSRPEVIRQELAHVSVNLRTLTFLSDCFSSKLEGDLDPGVFWGLLGLAIKVGSESEPSIQRVSDILGDLRRRTERFQKLCGARSTLPISHQEVCFFIVRKTTEFFAMAIPTLIVAEDMGRRAEESQRLQNQFEQVNGDIKDKIESLEALLTSDELPEWPRPELLPSRKDSPRCNMAPSNTVGDIFDRLKPIEEIGNYLEKSESNRLKAILIHGTPGVGSSTVAIKYARQQYDERALDNILWVNAESEVAIDQSFTKIAKALKLGNGETRANGDNLVLVMDWLQNTNHKWLIVYDNANQAQDVRNVWPNSGSRGQVIITTRKHSFLFGLVHKRLKISFWDENFTMQFFIKLLENSTHLDLSEGGISYFRRLSSLSGGHPLTVVTMAEAIDKSQCTAQQLIDTIERSPNVHSRLGMNLAPVFGKLSEDAKGLLAVLAFYDQEGLPQDLFKFDALDSHKDQLHWCADANGFHELVIELESYISSDPVEQCYGVHRFIQNTFINFLPQEKREAAFKEASLLLYAAFPRRDAAVGQMFSRWADCSPWIPHVIALKERFKAERKRTVTFPACREFCELLVTCQRYLLEHHNFEELEDMIEANRRALRTLPDDEQTSDLKASLPSHLGQMEARLGLAERALTSAMSSYEFRRKERDPEHKEIMWSQHNVAQVHTTFSSWAEAEEWHRGALSTWDTQVMGRGGAAAPAPGAVRTGLGRCLIYLRRYDEARNVLAEALADLKEGDNWAMIASAYFTIGRLEMSLGDYEEAEKRFKDAAQTWNEGARTDHFYGGFMYRLACCAHLRGDLQAARKYLENARVVTDMHKDTMIGEHARYLYKLSQLQREESRPESEAETTLEKAHQAYRAYYARPGVRISNMVEDPGEEDFDNLVYCLWR